MRKGSMLSSPLGRTGETPCVGVKGTAKKGSSGGSVQGSTGSSDCSVEELEDDLLEPELPPELEFMGATGLDKGKRRTDRYDSSESSDSGVVTLSPSTSDTTELTLSSPYSPCCDSSSSDAASNASSPASPTSSSPPPPTLHPVKPTSLLGHPIMTAVSAVLAAADNKRASSTSASFIPYNGNNRKSGNNPFSNCDPKPSAIPASPSPALINHSQGKASSPQPGSEGTASLKPGEPKAALQSSGNRMVATTGKDILAAALSFHQQQQEKQKQLGRKESASTNNNNNNIIISNNKYSDLKCSEDTDFSAVPSKKPRLETMVSSSASPAKSKPVIVAKKLNVGGTSPSSPVKKVKRKLVEVEDSSSSSSASSSVVVTTTSVEASAVQHGRICSVEESIKIVTTSTTTSTGGAVNSVSTNKAGVVVQQNPCGGCCLWKGCQIEAVSNLLEHIQTVHVSQQTKGDSYVCLWEGCKVFNHKSSKLSWLERHVLSHSGNKPFKCIFPGCGQSFGVQKALERHVNSHMSTGGGTLSIPNRKMESSPFKGPRRKKHRYRKQRVNLGQHVDFFDRRVMDLIKHRVAASVNYHTCSAHQCTFRGQVIAKRSMKGKQCQVLVHWVPETILPDEWMDMKDFSVEKTVPLTQIPKEKLPLIFPSLFPSPSRQGQKSRRKWIPPNSSSESSSASSTSEESGSSKTSKSQSTTSDSDDDDWAIDLLIDKLLVTGT